MEERFPLLWSDPQRMGGSPCVRNTRIPVYMVVAAVEECGSVEAAKGWYPRLTSEEIKECVYFARCLVEEMGPTGWSRVEQAAPTAAVRGEGS